jgi:hypothetical protein
MVTTSNRFGNHLLTVEYPDDWHFSERPVPNLAVPREMFAIANYPVPEPPKDSDVPRPLVADLSDDAIVLWSYFQTPGDPSPLEDDRIPNYPPYRPPLQFREAEVRAPTDAREWDPGKFTWSRVGFALGEIQVTLWTWVGTSASAKSIETLDGIISSVRVE